MLLERMFSPGYVQRGPDKGPSGPDGLTAVLDLPKIPLNLAAKQYLDPEGKYTLDYLEYTGLTEEDLARVDLEPIEPAGKIVQKYIGGHIETWARIEVKGKKRPLEMPLSKALTFMSVPEVHKKEKEGTITKFAVRRGGKYRSVVKLKGRKPRPLDEVCEKAAEKMALG